MLIIEGMNLCELGMHKEKEIKHTVLMTPVNRKRKLKRKSKSFVVCVIFSFYLLFGFVLGITKTTKAIITLFKKQNKMKCEVILLLLSSLNKVLYALMRFFSIINNKN